MPRDPFLREKFSRVHTAARTLAIEYFERYPKERYQTEVESWRRQKYDKRKSLSNQATRRDRAEGEQMSELELLNPTPELPDDTPVSQVRFPTRILNALRAAGLRTVGEVREASDEMLVSLPDLGRGSVRQLRQTLGLPFSVRAAW
jgi:DNA-directed RNA polymerase alpha subunit